ncbi:MAG: PAS domain S-box protein [Anaerolineales bacterium]|nr:PAS domain S-box protein [Anaerolineales bacterium]
MLPDLRVRQRDYLLEVSRALTEELELKKVLTSILRYSTELLAGHAGLIALRETGGGWNIASSFGINPAFLKSLKPLLDDIPDHGDPARFALPEISRRLQRLTEAATLGFLSGVGLPLIAQSEVLGVIFVFRSYRGRFSSEDRALLQSFASQAAIAVYNASLYSQVTEQKQFLDAVLEASADGIFVLDPHFRFQRVNKACATMVENTPEEIIGRHHSEIIQWRRREPGLTFEEAEAGGWPLTAQAQLEVEGDLETKEGGMISVGITYAPVLTSDNKLIGVVANMRDITKFREAEELKSTFISIISHELRTPVALIKGYVGTLRREDADWDPEVVHDSLAVIEEESDRLASLIDDLLDASRLQAGALVLNLSEVDLNDLTNESVKKFQIQTDMHTFEMNFSKDFPIVIADEERLRQVINNLLSNAVKYSKDGGVIQIRGLARPEEVAICVMDEGPGIAEEDIPHVFDRFYRSSKAAQRTKGAGLGLYLARAVIEAHGGRIWIEPRAKRGTSICFSIPRT